MERTLRDILEWVVLGLLVVVVVLLAFWLGGWIFTFLGKVLLALSDLILVMHGGRIVGELTPEEATEERLGLLMAGVTA